jgi:hypothetical protein
VDGLFIHEDHIMPPRARYIFGGDMRVCHSYGGLNPAAIILAPITRSTRYDLNETDDTASLYNNASNYMRLEWQSDGTVVLKLWLQPTGTEDYDATASTGNAKAWTIAAGDTLQKVVDQINATVLATDNVEWRAQVAPGANPEADASLYLTPHTRAITNCVSGSGAVLTRAAGGLSKVAVGAIGNSATTVTSSQYVASIDSDTQLTLSADADAASTETVTFYYALGDDPDTDESTVATLGWQRVISNSSPGFLYFNKTYLDLFPRGKNTVWMTTASPGATKSAPNNFVGRAANRFTAPGDSGISQGGFAADNGFVTPFAGKNAVIRNTRDSGTGLDRDYRMFMLNESSGCIAWNSVIGNGRMGFMLKPEGIYAVDLFNERLTSGAIYDHSTIPTPTGDFNYEAPQCEASAAEDDDDQYMAARIMRGALWLSYRSASGHPGKVLRYPIAGDESAGLAAAFRPDGSPWGWSLECDMNITVMCEGRRAALSNVATHLYGWNEQNAVASADGRIEEFETGNDDNTAEISASIRTPSFRFGQQYMSAQEVTIEHATAATNTTLSFKFHRSTSDDSYTLTPVGSDSLLWVKDEKLLPLNARAPAAACYLEFLQTAGTGGASELKQMQLRAKRLPIYGRGPTNS